MIASARKKSLFSFGLFGFCALFYLFFTFLDGPILTPDSSTYLSMSLHREPLYPLYLALFRLIFGAVCGRDGWLFLAVAGQGLLAAAAAWSLPACLYRRRRLSGWAAAVLTAFPLIVSLLCRFGAGRQAMYSNGIESEALSIPLFLLFFRFLYTFLLGRLSESASSRSPFLDRDFLLAALLCILLISTRKQMLFTLFLLAAALAFNGAKTHKIRRFLTRSLFAAIAVLGLCSGLDRSYNYFLRDEGVRHSGDSRFLLTMVVYTADREDAQRIQDPRIRSLFLEIYDTCDAEGYLKSSAPEGWLGRVSHFGDHYDHIQINTLRPAVTAYVEKNSSGSETDQAAQVDQIMNEMTKALLPSCLPSLIGCFFDNLLSGLVTTVALRTPVLIAAAALFYAGYLILFMALIYRRADAAVLLFSALTLLSILANVALVSAVIFCQSRYTIYNMPLFYMSGFWMLLAATNSFRSRRV